MIKKFDIFNESVRDRMTPISKESYRDLLYQYFNKQGAVLSDRMKEQLNGFDVDNLYMVHDESKYWSKVSQYFHELTRGERPKSVKVGKSELEIYSEFKVVKYWNGSLQDIWFFDKSYIDRLVDYIVGNKVTESLRDKMTPKSDEDIVDKIDKVPGHKVKDEIYNAIWDEDERMLSIVTNNYDPKKIDVDDKYDLCSIAIMYGNIDILQWLLDSGLDEEMINELILSAKREDKSEIVDLLYTYM